MKTATTKMSTICLVCREETRTLLNQVHFTRDCTHNLCEDLTDKNFGNFLFTNAHSVGFDTRIGAS